MMLDYILQNLKRGDVDDEKKMVGSFCYPEPFDSFLVLSLGSVKKAPYNVNANSHALT